MFYSFLIPFLFSVISVAQNNGEVVFDYPDYLCPDIEDVEVHLNGDGRVDLSEFLRNAKRCLDQSDYDNKGFIEIEIAYIIYELEELCDNDAPTCLENVKASVSEVQENLLEYQQARILYPYDYQKVGELSEYDIEGANLMLQNEEGCSCSDLFLAKMLMYGSEAQHNRVMNRLKSLGTSCLRSMFNALVNPNSRPFNEFLNSIQTSSILNSCQDQRDHPICRKLNNDVEVIQQRISSLLYSI